MGIVGFEIHANSASTLHYATNSLSSYTLPISLRPFYGNALKPRVALKIRVSHASKPNFGTVIASLNGDSSAGLVVSDALIPNESEFKPSFDEYLKAMESARTVRGNEKRAATTQKMKKIEKGDEGDNTKKINSVARKIGRKHGLEKVVYKEGSSRSESKVRKTPTKGFKSENDGKESKLYTKGKQKNGANVRDGSLKRRNYSLESESDDCSEINESGSERMSKSMVRSSLNGSHRGVTRDLYSSKMLRENVVSSRQRDYNTQSKTLDGDKIVARKEVKDRGLGRTYSENGSLVNRNGLSNDELNGGCERSIDRGYDSDDLEVDRAAFENLEDPNSVIRKVQFSHKDMEEKIQNLAQAYAVYSFFHTFGIPEMDKIICSGFKYMHIIHKLLCYFIPFSFMNKFW